MGWKAFREGVAACLEHEKQLDEMVKAARKKYGTKEYWPHKVWHAYSRTLAKMKERDELLLQLAKELVRTGVK
ncbi:MAG: hypothetical protein ACYDH4_10135 [Candidatus Cryosericum sp.]